VKKLTLPKALAISVVATSLLAACPANSPEPPCTYYCTTDAALAESKSDMFGGVPDPIFTNDAGSCQQTFC
jgi:hypothetical protein